MALVSVLVCFLSFFLFCNGNNADPKHPFQVGHFEQFADHFNEASYKDHTFQQKYLYSNKSWKAGSGPIFFYTGNEGPIEGFWKASGFVHELAADLGALVVFAEHRYYGSSLPFGNESMKMPYLGLLSVDQAMADYALLISNLLSQKNTTGCKVITFGGSYGGMLAAYMRFKYPNLVDGALAASAPIYMQDPTSKRDFFFSHVTKDFKEADEFCVNLAFRVFALTEMFSKDPPGLAALGRYFKLCDPLHTAADYQNFLGWVRNGFVMLAMMDYPYPSDFMGHFPAFPVEAACKALTTAHNPLFGLGYLIGTYYNSTQDLKCYKISEQYRACADPTGCGVGPDSVAWDYQACTEIWLPESSNGKSDMFPNAPQTDEMRKEYCTKTYGVEPRHSFMAVDFWGANIQSSSNIIFSNGDLDPWMGGGVTENVSDSIVAIQVKGGAHHLDLRGANKADPPGVTEARKQERAIIAKWVGAK